MALASLSLASKTTESPRRVREILLPANRLLDPLSTLHIPSEHYDRLRATLVQAELMVLRALRFEVRVPLALDFVPRYLHRTLEDMARVEDDYDRMGQDDKDEYRIGGLMETATARACHAKVVVAYKSYHVANFYPARAIAAACVVDSLRDGGVLLGSSLDDWLDHVTGGTVEREELDEITGKLGS